MQPGKVHEDLSDMQVRRRSWTGAPSPSSHAGGCCSPQPGRGPVHQAQDLAAAAGVPGHPGGVHQGGAKEPEAGAAALPRGGQAHPVRAPSDRPVPGDGGCQLRHRGLHHRLQLLRPHPQHAEPGATQALLLRGPAPALQRTGGHLATRGGLLRILTGRK
eukprot:scaffold159135_cov18-Tisochrysis_lutea.AAC.1